MIPHNLDLEVALLAVAVESDEARATAVATLQTDDFYDALHAKLFAALADMANANEPSDLLVLSSRSGLPVGKIVELLDGGRYGLPASAPSYCARLRQYGELRRGLLVYQEAIDRASKAATPEEGMAALTKVSDRVRDTRTGGLTSALDAANDLWATLDASDASEVKGAPVATGFETLDRMLNGGLRPGQLIVLGARPKCGKSALACNTIPLNVASNGGRVLVFSMEMRVRELLERMVSGKSRAHLSDLQSRNLDDGSRASVLSALNDISQLDLHFGDQRGMTVRQIAATARRANMAKKVDLIVVDYIQIVRPTSTTQSREQQVAEITRELKTLAGECECPVLALSQLNRGIDTRGDNADPRMSDLRESGSLEQDADVILLLNGGRETGPGEAEVTCIVAGSRASANGKVRMIFDKAHTTFLDGGAFGVPESFATATPSPERKRVKIAGVKHTPASARAGE